MSWERRWPPAGRRLSCPSQRISCTPLFHEHRGWSALHNSRHGAPSPPAHLTEVFLQNLNRVSFKPGKILAAFGHLQVEFLAFRYTRGQFTQFKFTQYSRNLSSLGGVFFWRLKFIPGKFTPGKFGVDLLRRGSGRPLVVEAGLWPA